MHPTQWVRPILDKLLRKQLETLGSTEGGGWSKADFVEVLVWST